MTLDPFYRLPREVQIHILSFVSTCRDTAVAPFVHTNESTLILVNISAKIELHRIFWELGENSGVDDRIMWWRVFCVLIEAFRQPYWETFLYHGKIYEDFRNVSMENIRITLRLHSRIRDYFTT